MTRPDQRPSRHRSASNPPPRIRRLRLRSPRVRATLALLVATIAALGACEHARLAPGHAGMDSATGGSSDAPSRPPPAPDPRPPPRTSPALASSAAVPSPAPSVAALPSPDRYAWLGDEGYAGPVPDDTLESRFPDPAGAHRVALETQSFGAWLRGLPLAAPDTPVRSHTGRELHPVGDPRVAAVVAIDVGTADLQQCADAVLRLHAEWRWSQGHRDLAYQAASGLALPFSRYARGERVVAQGNRLEWKAVGRAGQSHRAFRSYLDMVFAWANTVSVARQARPVAASELRPGDFFILPGNPGHSVLVLDLAESADGQLYALLGQSYMPAQNVHVLKPPGGGTWWTLELGEPVATPFWRPFPWESLRRLPD